MSTVTLSGVTRTPLTEELDQIFREHHPLVFRTAYGVTGSREDAQDVLQTLFLRLLRKELPPDFRKNPKAYLYRAAVNTSLNIIRERKRRERRDATASLETHPDGATFGEDLHARLYEAIAELEPEAAHTLVLRYVHNYSIAEIANLLGKSRGVIAVRLFRSRARLKQLVRGPHGEKE
jgi:RNA polymerase sigma-70 factor (ECF subfamily)